MNTHNPNAFIQRTRRPVGDVQIRPDDSRVETRTLTSQSLFQGEYEIGIDHGGSMYRLKITRQGKLILNK